MDKSHAKTELDKQERLSKICDLLVGAGYFRARLNIDPFDKILGGMCWSINGSNYDIDIEFEDDMNLGQKVKLSEKIIAALRTMKCPHGLAPHQVNGLDYKALEPVIKYLIEVLYQSRDTRKERTKN
jgi:hypothetical protein